mmetsp:Transcript_5372/g.10124  ORF Transcript_5372/g.10124 Transcript_5372/m.10124 type:complete len:205 (-) Transcript_5372:39-653(-)
MSTHSTASKNCKSRGTPPRKCSMQCASSTRTTGWMNLPASLAMRSSRKRNGQCSSPSSLSSKLATASTHPLFCTPSVVAAASTSTMLSAIHTVFPKLVRVLCNLTASPRPRTFGRLYEMKKSQRPGSFIGASLFSWIIAIPHSLGCMGRELLMGSSQNDQERGGICKRISSSQSQTQQPLNSCRAVVVARFPESPVDNLMIVLQ